MTDASTMVMGFDFGMKKIGVAVGQRLTATATPIDIIKARDGIPDWQQLSALIDEWQPGLLVVGLPLNMDDSAGLMASRAQKFARRLSHQSGLPHIMVDERLSSREARAIGSETGMKPGEAVDGVAARLILETYFSQST